MIAVIGLATVALAVSGVVFAPETASREKRFANPPASARLLPIRHHRPDDRARADAEIADLVDKGYGGMVVNAPTGKRYMVATNGWGTFRHVVRTCREKGLSLWLYDEDGYPSGSARDLVLKDHPEWTACGILLATKDGSGGTNVKVSPPPGAHRRTFICPLAGDRPDLLRLQPLPVIAHGTNDVEIAFPPGTDTRWRALVVSVGPVYEGSHASCNISRRCKYPNLLMREPTAEFIRVTHGTYARELGADLGAFTSTFTDEPSLMTYWFKPMEYVPLPWSEELAADYAAKTGRELLDDVPDLLFASVDDGDSPGKRHFFWKMVADRVADNYFGQIRAWCRRTGIGSGGHLLFEEGIPGHVGLYGDFFRCLRTLDNPGMDCLTSIPKSVPWRTARLAGSAGALNGAKRVMCEVSDHSQRYREPGNAKPIRYVTEDEVKGTIARLVWGGINTLTSYYVFDRLGADAQRRINLTAGRLITLMSEGHDASDVAVLYPSDAMMATYEPSLQFGGGARTAAISEKFCQATELLYKAGRPFLIVDAASLAETKVEGGELVRGDLRWRTVVLPTKRFLDSSVLDRLAEFERAGGRVLESDQVEAALAKPGSFEPLPFRIVSGDASAAKFLWAHRRTATEDIWLVVSRSASAWKGAVGCPGDTACGEIRRYDPFRGTCETVAGSRIELDLPPWGAAVLVAGRQSPPWTSDWRLDRYSRIEGNLLVVDVPAGAQGGLAHRSLDLTKFPSGVELYVRCRGESISKPKENWLGSKFMLHYTDGDGVEQWPGASQKSGTFDWCDLRFAKGLRKGVKGGTAALSLGLQGATGKIVFDLSALRILERTDHWTVPESDRGYRCAYTSAVAEAPRKRGVMLPSRRCREDDFRTLREWGVTLGRYQMCRNWTADNDNRDLDEFDRWLDGKLDQLDREVLPWAEKYGLDIVVDLHVAPGGRANSDMNMFYEKPYGDHFVRCWQKIARRFKGRRNVYGYDLINEPNQQFLGVPDGDWWSLQRRAAEAVRAIDPDVTIVIESNGWAAPTKFPSLRPLRMTNVIYQAHVYQPLAFTHQGVDGSRRVKPTKYPDPAKGWDRDFLRKQLADVRNFQLEHGAKIYIGEFSAAAWAEGADAYLRDCIALFEEYGWDWTYHAFREWPGWSVEHEGTGPSDMKPSADTLRKQVLLRALQKESI